MLSRTFFLTLDCCRIIIYQYSIKSTIQFHWSESKFWNWNTYFYTYYKVEIEKPKFQSSTYCHCWNEKWGVKICRFALLYSILTKHCNIVTWDVMTCVSPGCRLWGISSPRPCGQFVTCNHINRSQNVVKSDHCTQASDVRTKISDFSCLIAALFISSLYLFVAGGNQIPPPGAAAAKYCLICPNLGPGIVSMSRPASRGSPHGCYLLLELWLCNFGSNFHPL